MRRALGLAILLLTQTASARPVPAQRQLEIAERLFGKGLYRETLEQLEKVPGDPELRVRVWLLGALSSYKLDDLPRADQLARQVLEKGFSAQASLLRGMVAFRRQRWELSLQHLREVVASGEEPWDSAAFTLMGEVEAAQSAVRRAYDSAISEAQRWISGGQLRRAEGALARAESLLPGELPTRYYRGLLAYQLRQYHAAEHWLKAAIALDRRDSWSAYMLALTQGELGDPRGARASLAALARGAADPVVRRTARRALEVMAEGGASPHSFDVRLETGSAFDTNPTYINESSASLRDAGLALHLAGRLSYQHRVAERIHLGGGIRFLERGYAVGGEGAALTELDPALSLLLSGKALRFGLSFRSPLQLYGHEPFSTVPGGELHASLSARPWLALLLGGHLGQRLIHNADYEHLQALTAGGSLGARGSFGSVDLELSYFVQRSDARQVTRALTDAASTAYRLTTDYSAWGHGPRLAGLARLPWRLRLFASVGFALYHFGSNDQLVRTGDGATLRFDPRQDGTLSLEVELARSLPAGFEVALRLESVDNFSTIRRSEVGIDYTYSRRLAGVVVGWSWPARYSP